MPCWITDPLAPVSNNAATRTGGATGLFAWVKARLAGRETPTKMSTNGPTFSRSDTADVNEGKPQLDGYVVRNEHFGHVDGKHTLDEERDVPKAPVPFSDSILLCLIRAVHLGFMD